MLHIPSVIILGPLALAFIFKDSFPHLFLFESTLDFVTVFFRAVCLDKFRVFAVLAEVRARVLAINTFVVSAATAVDTPTSAHS